MRINASLFYLYYGIVPAGAGAVQRDIRHLAGLAHDEHLQGPRHLAACQDGQVNQLRVLNRKNEKFD